ncbi:MAG: TonB-dependent receptor [Deltaproteobacteria bacterium]|nr:TonB-dependent receptor [Deltaproteobacteria bacterium]
MEVTAKDIEDKNARTLDEALELLPGLDVRTGAQGIPRINLRGLRSRHVILLLNGIPFNSTYDGQFDPSAIPTENIAKIKLTYGTHSVLYGQGGLGGVINIITKKGKQGFNGGLSGEIDERGGKLGRFNMSGGGEKYDFFLSGSAENSDGFRLSHDFDATPEEGGGLRENSDNERENLFANVGFAAGEDWKIGLIVQGSDGEFGKPPSVINDRNDPFAKRPKYERVEDYDGFSAQLTASYDPETPFGLRAWVFYNELEEDLARYDDSNYNSITQRRSYRKDDKTRRQGGTLQTSYELGRAGRLVGAFSARTDEYESDGANGRGDPIDSDEDLEIYSVALEYDVSPFSNFEFVVGYSYHWLDKDGGRDDDRGSFLVGTRYHISEKTRARASVARKIRFPSIKQLYNTDGGNPDLTTEKSTNYELGITHQLPWDMEADLVGFWIDVDDYIEKDSITDIYENHDEYRFRGIEFTLEKRFMETGSVRLGYTYLDSEDRSSGTQVDELEYRPEHKIALDGRYAWNFGLSAYANVMYLADQYHYSDTDPLLKRKLNSYTLVDVKLEQKFISEWFYAYAGANNLFDKDYEESYGFPQAGRMVYGGMKVAF